MSEQHEEPNTEVEREERRLERLRLISVVALPERYEDDDDTPRAA